MIKSFNLCLSESEIARMEAQSKRYACSIGAYIAVAAIKQLDSDERLQAELAEYGR